MIFQEFIEVLLSHNRNRRTRPLCNHVIAVQLRTAQKMPGVTGHSAFAAQLKGSRTQSSLGSQPETPCSPPIRTVEVGDKLVGGIAYGKGHCGL